MSRQQRVERHPPLLLRLVVDILVSSLHLSERREMSAYLEEHLPLLRSLHSSLGLPASALQEDETRIDAAIKAVVVSIVRERETEVENWKEAIDLAKRDVACIGRALGDRSAGKVEDETLVSAVVKN